jgi:FtsH-binding integral membrane protein
LTVEKRRQPLKNIGMLLLSIWLIATGLVTLVNFSFPSSGIIFALLAIAAGLLFLLDMRGKRLSGNLGIILLSIWLILVGLLPLLSVTVPYSDMALALLAVVAGALLLIRR